MGKASKRAAKDRAVQSLKGKAGARPCALDLLSEDLRSQYESAGLSLDDVLVAGPSKKAKGKAGKQPEQQQQQPEELSKSQLRKLKQVELKKERREGISKVLHQLHEHQASDMALALLRPLHQRGARETKKQRLRRELQMQRAGVSLPASLGGAGGGTELLRQRRVRGVHGGSDGSGSSSSSSSEDGSDGDDQDVEPAAGPAVVAPSASAAAGTADGPGGGTSGSEDDEEGEGEGEQEAAADAEEDRGAGSGPSAKRRKLSGPSPAAAPVAAAAAAAAGRAAPLAAAAAAAATAAQADPKQRRKEQMEAARLEAQRIRAQELDVVPDSREGDEQTAAALRQSAAAAAAAAHFPHRVVPIQGRPAAMAAARAALPITAMESEIMEAVAAHDVVVLCGETGCGKTTQVPQFLYEAGYGCRRFPEKAGAVGVTQPRRVAAISTAQRVAAEMGCKMGETVGYQVRYDRAVGSETSLKFMTDGILLRELQLDFPLSAYSAVVVDEAHERALNTDLLIGMLSRIVPLRRKLWQQQQEAAARGEAPSGPPVYPLKLIIMSATLRTSDFTDNKQLFPQPPPVIDVPARQFPVTVHFSRRTEMHDYVGAAFRKVARIHAELPPGGILVFLTGQREVEHLCRRLRSHYAKRAKGRAAGAPASGRDGASGSGQGGDNDADDDEEEEADAGVGGGDLAAQFGGDQAELAGESFASGRGGGGGDVEGDDDDYEMLNGQGSEDEGEDEEEVVVMGGGQFTPEEIAAAEARFEEQYGLKLMQGLQGGQRTGAAAAAPGAGAAGAGGATGLDGAPADGPAPVHVLPLYAMLPQSRQAKVFEAPPAGHRLIVVATNVAETSLTIPGIRYVVDAGRSKQRLLEEGAGGQLARYEVRWVSQAGSAQRAGRAGRTGPGHCYRLYSSAVFADTFPKHGAPEIANTSLEGVVLVMKSMGVDKVHNFPFPTPPAPSALLSAHRCLEALGALEPASAAAAAAGPGPSSAASREGKGRASAGSLTDIGRGMAAFPISPRHARMLLEVLRWQKRQQEDGEGSAQKQSGLLAGAGKGRSKKGGAGGGREGQPAAERAARALPYAVALAAALSTESPFIHIDTVAREGGGGEGEEEDGQEEGGGSGQGKAGPGPGSTTAEEAARQKRKHAASMQARFRHADGDALSALRALCAFEAAGESDAFCAQHFLHARNLREAADLHRQLLRVLSSSSSSTSGAAAGGDGRGPPKARQQPDAGFGAASGGLGGELADEARRLGGAGGMLAAVREAPSERVLALLRRAIAAGWADQVARRVRTAEYLQQLSEGRRKRHAVRYQPCGLDEHVYLHPRSALHGSSPELLVFLQLLRTDKRPYMAGLTAVEAEWLPQSGSPLCQLSAPLAEPKPFYQAAPSDAVLAWHEARYGRHEWPLPAVAAPHPDATERAAVFAAALLEGKVVPAMADLRPALLSSPAVLLRPEMRGVARVGELIAGLTRARVDSARTLAAAWKAKPTLLQAELAAWLGKSQQRALLQMWPLLLQQAGSVAAAAAVAGTGMAPAPMHESGGVGRGRDRGQARA